jgi:hypothetical protein
MAALRVGNWPEVGQLGPTDPAERAAFLGGLLLRSADMRIAVCLEARSYDHDWHEAATILLEEAKAITRANAIDDDPFAGLPS